MPRSWMFVAALAATFAVSSTAFSQAECNGWGEFRGIRIEGELVPFSTSVKLLDPDGKVVAFSATQTISNPKFSRGGNSQTSSASIGNNALSYTQAVQDLQAGVEGAAEGSAHVTIQTNGNRAMPLLGTFYYITLPATDYAGGKVNFIVDNGLSPAPTLEPKAAGEKYASFKAKGVRIIGAARQIEITFEEPTDITVQRDKLVDTDYFVQDGLRLPVDEKSLDRFSISFPLATGNMIVGQSRTASFTVKASAILDKKPVSLALDFAHPGPGFDGVGGNFRIQGAQDQAHLTYNLENLRVAWGRVEMPLAAWWPNENVDPVAAATTSSPASAPAAPARGRGRGGPGGPANTGVQQAMAMAKTLADKKIPFVISTWGVPQWALGPSQRKPDQPAGIQAQRLNPEKLDAVCKAMVSYLAYLKKNDNAEPVALSFNESDLGINVLFTPQEHADFIKRLGKMLHDANLSTRLLLGDACSPHPVHFIDAAMNDPECLPYIAAVSFHSWHDGTPEEFAVWGQAAQKLHVPLFCGEGGTDADAYRYPPIFLEPWFGMNEFDTYLKILQYGQAQSILHWQLTENYSVLTGGGGGTSLQPTRRFFNLKQLNLTPPNAPFIPLTGTAPEITHAAYADPAKGLLAIHLLNNGAAREVTLTNLPASFHELTPYLTDQTHHMQALEKISVTSGTAKFTLSAAAYTTLTAAP